MDGVALISIEKSRDNSTGLWQTQHLQLLGSHLSRADQRLVRSRVAGKWEVSRGFGLSTHWQLYTQCVCVCVCVKERDRNGANQLHGRNRTTQNSRFAATAGGHATVGVGGGVFTATFRPVATSLLSFAFRLRSIARAGWQNGSLALLLLDQLGALGTKRTMMVVSVCVLKQKVVEKSRWSGVGRG